MNEGRKPIAEKGTINPFLNASTLGSLVDVDPAFKAAAKKKGFDLRWANSKEMALNQGFNKNFWVPIKRDEFGVVEGSTLTNTAFGESPDKTIRRGDLILCKRSTVLGDQHREALRQRQAAYNNVV